MIRQSVPRGQSADMAPDSTDVAVAMDVEGGAVAVKRVVLDSGTAISVKPLYGVKGTRPPSITDESVSVINPIYDGHHTPHTHVD
tara:strand:+ start:24033 stop:24287 length:255 start_codon:yes stop_codon:yes gene_type:complete